MLIPLGNESSLTLPQRAVEALRNHRKRQAEEQLRAGARWADNGLVFVTTIGTPVDAQNIVNRHFKPLLKRAGLPDIRWHDLRQSVTTTLTRQQLVSQFQPRLGDVEMPPVDYQGLHHSAYSPYLWAKKRVDERTRTADPPSLRVIIQALQGCAGDCKCRIFRGVSFPCLALCCTVLRSRWYQSGINVSLLSA